MEFGSHLQQLDRIYSSAEELLSDVDKKTTVPSAPAFQKSIRLYYIARYFVAVHESRHGEIPIQVWNEYRNTLDHYFRYLAACKESIGEDDDGDKNLYKMNGHLQRACLDALKIFCHRSNDQISELLNRYKPEVLSLVDNRNFYPCIITKRTQALKAFENAKVSDLQLGEDAKHNSEILKNYLDASFLFDEIIFQCLSKEEDIAAAQNSHQNISSQASALSEKHELKVHAKFHIMWTALTVPLGFIFGKFTDPLMAAARNLFGF